MFENAFISFTFQFAKTKHITSYWGDKVHFLVDTKAMEDGFKDDLLKNVFFKAPKSDTIFYLNITNTLNGDH